MIYSQCVLEWVLLLRSALCGENFGNKLGWIMLSPGVRSWGSGNWAVQGWCYSARKSPIKP